MSIIREEKLRATARFLGQRIRALRKHLRLAQSANAYLCSDQAMQDLRNNLERVEADRDSLQSLFDLQRTRSDEATELWRKAHNITDGRWPDLGALLGWLMAEIARLQDDRNHLVERPWDGRGCEVHQSGSPRPRDGGR